MYQRIKNLREDHDLTQKEIAEILNISQRGYSHYETGNNDVSSEVLIKLAKFYKVSVDYILDLTDEKKQYKRKTKEKK